MTTDPEWLTPGAVVCEVTIGNRGGGSITTARVDRVLKRDVVLSNGHRYNRERLSKSTGWAWYPTTDLLPPDDPIVARVQAENLDRRRRDSIRTEADLILTALQTDDWTAASEAWARLGHAIVELADA